MTARSWTAAASIASVWHVNSSLHSPYAKA